MTPYDLDIWAKTVYGEARNQSPLGKLAVAYVIKNRADTPKRWPDTPSAVCLQRRQFSCWNKGDPNVHAIARLEPTDPVYLACLHAVLRAYLGLEPDPTGANHYAVVGTNPYWARGKVSSQRIGDHEFWTL